jgi:hypothetical protein
MAHETGSRRELLQHDLDKTPGRRDEDDTSPTRGGNSVVNNDQTVGGEAGSRSTEAPGEGQDRGGSSFDQDPSERHRGHGPDIEEQEQGILEPGGDDAYSGDDVSRLERAEQG